jgi:hypothetical protein
MNGVLQPVAARRSHRRPQLGLAVWMPPRVLLVTLDHDHAVGAVESDVDHGAVRRGDLDLPGRTVPRVPPDGVGGAAMRGLEPPDGRCFGNQGGALEDALNGSDLAVGDMGVQRWTGGGPARGRVCGPRRGAGRAVR